VGGYSSSSTGNAYLERSLASFTLGLVALESMAAVPKGGWEGSGGADEWGVRGGGGPRDPAAAPSRPRAHQQGATLFMVLQAAFHALLHLWLLSPVVAVAVPMARRPILGLQGTLTALLQYLFQYCYASARVL